jgi:pyruvate formate lyase activating enzyme
MIFAGIQKLTLLDYPDKTACTLFTIGCNFSCLFCQNPSLLQTSEDIQTISASEIFEFLKKRHGLLDGVCISGGEPLMQDELADFIGEVKKLGYLVKLDTNGSYPDKLKALVESGTVDYVAMDIKNSPEKYAQTICVSDFDFSMVEESVSFLLSCAIPYEFRTTVVRQLHTVDELRSIARWISGARKYCLQVFFDSEDVPYSGLNSYNEQEIKELLKEVEKVIPTVELRGF